MFCRYCGAGLPEESRFCNTCGKSQQLESIAPATDIDVLAVPLLPSSPMSVGEVSGGNVPMVAGVPSVPGFADVPPANAGASSPPSLKQPEPIYPWLLSPEEGAKQETPLPQPITKGIGYSTNWGTSPIAHQTAASGLKGAGHLSRRALLLILAGIVIAIVIGIVIYSLVGGSALDGNWKADASNPCGTITLQAPTFDSGQHTVTLHVGLLTFTKTYEDVDSSHIKFGTGLFGTPQVFSYAVSGNALTLTNTASSQTCTFTRTG